MKPLTRTASLALLLGATSMANASIYTFTDSTSVLVSETSSIARTVGYSGLDGAIVSAFLTIDLSDDQSSTAPAGFVDVPVEYAKLTVGGNTYTSGDIDGNNVPGTLGPFSYVSEVDLIASGVAFSLTPPSASATPNPAVGTIGTYFNIDVTSLLSGTSGSLGFDLTALDTIASFPAIPFVFPGGSYIEDFNYENAVLSITTVPVPAAAWLMGSGLIGLLSFSRKKTITA